MHMHPFCYLFIIANNFELKFKFSRKILLGQIVVWIWIGFWNLHFSLWLSICCYHLHAYAMYI